MHRFIIWFNSFKTRLKSKRFIIPIIFALAFLFFPKDAFALEINNVQFYNNGSLVHTFNKNEIQGQYASINPIEVDAMHINYGNVTQKNSYNYQFEGNFDMAGDRVFDTIRAFNINNGVSQQTSSSKWILYSAEVIQPFYNGNYSISADWTSINDSNVLSLQFDLGGDMILSSFRLNHSRLLNDGEDVGDSITNQTQQIIQNQDKNQQDTNVRLDKIDETIKNGFEDCRKSVNLFNAYNYTYTNDGSNGYSIISATDINVSFDSSWARLKVNIFGLKPNTTYTISSYLDKSNFNTNVNSGFYSNDQGYQNNAMTKNSGDVYYVFTTDSNGKFDSLFYGNWGDKSYTGNIIYTNIQINEGNSPKPFEKYGVDICKNRIDETNDKLDNLDKTLNDDNVNGATSTGNDFFDNFNSKDNGGISRIVTMPLTLINGLISGGTCSNLEFEVLGKEVYFPSGCILWQNAPSSIVTIYRTIICGLFSYILATHLFKDIEDLKNPNKEEVSTLDL